MTFHLEHLHQGCQLLNTVLGALIFDLSGERDVRCEIHRWSEAWSRAACRTSVEPAKALRYGLRFFRGLCSLRAVLGQSERHASQFGMLLRGKVQDTWRS